jgi:hypothetical protein
MLCLHIFVRFSTPNGGQAVHLRHCGVLSEGFPHPQETRRSSIFLPYEALLKDMLMIKTEQNFCKKHYVLR